MLSDSSKMESGKHDNKSTSDVRSEQMSDQDRNESIYLNDGQTHTVWKPEHKTSLGDRDIFKRRKELQNRVWATQQVLKVQSNDENRQRHTDPVQRRRWQKALNNTIVNNRKALKKKSSVMALPFHDIVSQYATTISTCDDPQAQSVDTQVKSDARKALRLWKSQYITTPSNLPVFSSIPEETELTQEVCSL